MKKDIDTATLDFYDHIGKPELIRESVNTCKYFDCPGYLEQSTMKEVVEVQICSECGRRYQKSKS